MLKVFGNIVSSSFGHHLIPHTATLGDQWTTRIAKELNLWKTKEFLKTAQRINEIFKSLRVDISMMLMGDTSDIKGYDGGKPELSNAQYRLTCDCEG